MKAKPAEVARAIERAGRGGGDIRLFLLHGPDEAGAAAHVARLAEAMGAEAERIDIDGATLGQHPGRLADEAAGLSLFGGRRYIRATGVGEDAVEAVGLLLAATGADNPVVLLAPGVRGTGKLVRAVTAAPNAMALALYLPDARGAAAIVAGLARDAGLRIAPDVAAMLADAAGGDRGVLANEVAKLALYCDAAPDRPQDADAEAVAAVVAGLDEPGIAEAVAAVIDGAPDALGADLAGLETANLTIPMLRGLTRRLIALAEMRAAVDAGERPDAVVARTGVFWKERDATERALRRWALPAIVAGIAQVRRAERALIAPASVGAVAAGQSMVTLARMSARR